MNNLENFNNIYASLAESAYNGRPNDFPMNAGSSNPTKIDFSKNIKKNNGKITVCGGKKLPNNGKVYLQPDPTVKTIKEQPAFPLVNAPATINSYQKGLLTDEKAGYNSYFVTDTPKLSEQTKNTYFVTRGSDGIGPDTLNDWWDNNAQFTLNDTYIPQAQLATKAMHTKISEMNKQAPNAKMSVTGHSLGTMVSIQAVANLPAGDIDKIERVVLFQGPDARESIAQMSQQAQENIKKLEAAGKIDYYVNPFDLVSMLNRNQKGVDEIGNVHFLLPKSYTTTFDMAAKNGSSHDFGQYQINSDGTIQVANVKEHPELFIAAQELSTFIDRTLNQLERVLVPGSVTVVAVLAAISSGGTNVIADIVAVAGGALTYTQAKKIYEDYLAIIEKAQAASERNQKVNRLQEKIQASSGSQKLRLQEDLVREVAAQAAAFGTDYQTIVETIVTEAEDEIDEIVREVETAARSLQHYLSDAEVAALIADFKKEALWDAAQATAIATQTQAYQQKLTKISQELEQAATKMKNADERVAKLFQE
jgi:hypothetical protein